MTVTEPADRGFSERSDGRGRPSRPLVRRVTGGGTDGNEQLTNMLGVLLLLLFGALGITIVAIGQLMWWHLFLGVLLVPPVGAKMASTGYRFMRYYTSNPPYRRKGPPHIFLRLLGPVVVGSTIGVLLTGLVLMIGGPSVQNPWNLFHKGFFIIWIGAVGIHVLGHLAELPDGVRAVRRRAEEVARRRRADAQPGRGAAARRAARAEIAAAATAGSVGRTVLIFGSIALGLVLALLFVPDFAQWTAWSHLFHGGG